MSDLTPEERAHAKGGTMKSYEKDHLIMELSDLLNKALASGGDLTEEDWQREEVAQRRAYIIKHPEVLPRPENG